MGNSHNIAAVAGSKQKKTKWNEFFVTLTKRYKVTNETGMEFDSNPKRLVFISIDGLYRTWMQCPPTSLYNALFILPLKTKWIRSPKKCNHRYSLMLQDEAFVCLLRWKLSQKLLFCLLDDEADHSHYSFLNHNCQLVAPVWHRISSRLQELYDPIHRRHYRPLMLNETYWTEQSSLSTLYKLNHASPSQPDCGVTVMPNRFAVTANDIIYALHALSFKFNAIVHILMQSNASLNVMTSFQPSYPSTSACVSDLGGSDVVASAQSSTMSSMTVPSSSSSSPSPSSSVSDAATLNSFASLASSFSSPCVSKSLNPCTGDKMSTIHAHNDADFASPGFVWVATDYFDDL
mmetsp:Transcript_21568/g.34629  ORF Transcript_21568/g.34629 Transcript_21568/m.34629 type:complete len:347 (+) Transcript_21568:70-1110(+)